MVQSDKTRDILSGPKGEWLGRVPARTGDGIPWTGSAPTHVACPTRPAECAVTLGSSQGSPTAARLGLQHAEENPQPCLPGLSAQSPCFRAGKPNLRMNCELFFQSVLWALNHQENRALKKKSACLFFFLSRPRKQKRDGRNDKKPRRSGDPHAGDVLLCGTGHTSFCPLDSYAASGKSRGALLSECCLQNCPTPAPLEFHSRFLINKRMCSLWLASCHQPQESLKSLYSGPFWKEFFVWSSVLA